MTAKESSATASAAAAMSATPMMQHHPWSPWTNPLTTVQAPFQGAVNPWQQPQTGENVQAMGNAARLEYDQKTSATQLTPVK